MSNLTPSGGTVACGHPATAAAAVEMLADGGNAYDAALAALCAAFFAEPVLASPGGGGFLLAAPAVGKPTLYDFFCQTPGRLPQKEQLDFYPIGADFGTAVQEFHIGRAAVAVPGVVAGMFAMHRDLCRMPLQRIIEPALQLAREGVRLNRFQAEVFRIVAPIFRATPAARQVFRAEGETDQLPGEQDCLRLTALGETLQALAEHGEAYFYHGDIAQQFVRFCGQGGLLDASDFAAYRVERRAPLSVPYRNTRLLTNPLPSSGGTLIAFALQLLTELDGGGDVGGRAQLARVMAMTGQARKDAGLDDPLHADAIRLLDAATVRQYAAQIRQRVVCARGTTHISVVDGEGNGASLSVSNGEGCGDMLGDTGIMPNNMLGEEDLNPRGFHHWNPGTRITSMMAPSLVRFADGRQVMLGSGGSNRIRTAILQVIVNLVDHGMTLDEAIAAPRLHVENDLLSVEPGLPAGELESLLAEWPNYHLWEAPSLFFGGVHAVEWQTSGTGGVGDLRRSGVSATARPGGA